jgi:hypothetical protein
MSARKSIARAKASFIFHPPDRLPIACFWRSSLKPTDASVSIMSSWVARMRLSEMMNSRTEVSSSLPSMSCST